MFFLEAAPIQDDPGHSPHPKILKLITTAKTLLPWGPTCTGSGDKDVDSWGPFSARLSLVVMDTAEEFRGMRVVSRSWKRQGHMPSLGA